MPQSLEVYSEYLIGFVEVLRDHPELTNHGHVVRIASPAWHDMHM